MPGVLHGQLAAPAPAVSSGSFTLPLTHRTHDGEPRGEKQAESSQNQENYLSKQGEVASDEKCSLSDEMTSPLSCLSRISPLALTAQVVLLILLAVSLHLDSGLAVVGEIPEPPLEKARADSSGRSSQLR
jgi:hypothetical protein